MNILEISIDRDDSTGFMIVCKTPFSLVTMGAESLLYALEKLPLVAEEALKMLSSALKNTIGGGKPNWVNFEKLREK